MKVVPPNFSYVEDGIFRCGLPSPRHYGFLSSLQLRTCVLLTDTPDPIFYRWLLENNICVLCPLMSSGGTFSSGPLAGTSSANTLSLSYRGHPVMPSPLSILHPTTLSHYLPTTNVSSGSAPLVATGGFVGEGYPLASGSFPAPISASPPSTAAAPSSAVDAAVGGGAAPASSSTAGTLSTSNEPEEPFSNAGAAASSVALPPVTPPISTSGVAYPPQPLPQRSTDVPVSSMSHSSGESGVCVGGGTASLSLDHSAVLGAGGAIPSASSPVPSNTPSAGEGSSTALVPPANPSRPVIVEASGVGATASSTQNIPKSTTMVPTSGSNTSATDRGGNGSMSQTTNPSKGSPSAVPLPIAPPLPYAHPPSSPSLSPHHHHHHPPPPPPHTHPYVQYPGVELYFGDPRTSWIERREGMGEGASERVVVLPFAEEGTDTMRTLTGLMSLSESVVVRILEVLLDRTHYPLLITCSKGRYRTGIVCACLRKMQRWNLVSILEEYRRFAGDKSRAENEEFIELFDTDLVTRSGQKPSILY